MEFVFQDNCELPTHIGFDLPSSSNLPEIKVSWLYAQAIYMLHFAG